MGLAVSVPKVAWQPSETWRVVLPLTGVHLAMFGYDLAHPDRFLNADRAAGRLQVILGLPAAALKGETLSYIAAHGIPGDWLPQGLIYLLGGQYLLIAFQVALALMSVAWVRDIGRHVGLSEPSAAGAALLYGLLPHTLAFPHQLASEALFVPLVVLAFRASGLRTGAAIGLATLVRPITMLWPLIHVFAHCERRRYLALACAPLLLWMSFVFVASGEFSMGRSGHDLGTNLYWRLQRIGERLSPAERPRERPAGERRASLGDYVAFTMVHPMLTAEFAVRDMAVMGFKSGIERVVLDYLDLYPDRRAELQDANGGWRPRVDRGGAAALMELATSQPALVATAAAGALAFTLLMLLAVYGAARWARGADRLALVAFVVYIFVTVQAVDAAQSRLRAGAEFAICLLAVAGWTELRRKQRHGR